MNITALANGTTANGSGNASASANDTKDMFLQLLVTQLKSQSPLDPVDPNQFVGQLVQFNTLDQLVRIRELLEAAASSAPSGSSASSSTQSIQGGH